MIAKEKEHDREQKGHEVGRKSMKEGERGSKF